VHKIIDHQINDPIEITKENKKAAENKRNDDKRKIQRELLIKELEHRKQLELIAKESYERDQIARFTLLEEQKLKQQEDFLILNQKKEADCCICMVNMADTATIPCGHQMFCYACIDEYHKKNPHKGCPICKSDIVIISKIFK
jgi:hypothetical protein